ncbi:Proteasome subunit alpha type-5 [Perkinsus chesapeaki]|uniref:Proteasome subunit alpha type n=1 Tax=Perkinsus chesapeaki TaxID=330153 RepID=A0A7J6M5M9_PERCH|nr:Proteasome subunit alpha type-5 [Perkinsus chesapeaki]
MSFGGKSEYDRGVNTFSPEGRLFQVEYAIEAVKLGSTAIGITTKEGVVLAVEKRIGSPLIEPSSIEKIMQIAPYAGCAMSGLTADARTLVDHARVEALNHDFTYNEPMQVESIVHSISDMALDFSRSDDKKKKGDKKKKTMSRPFGVALLVAGVDADNGPQLFMADPSGSYTKYRAAAIGSAAEGATSILLEQYKESLTLKEAEDLALVVLRQVMEEKITEVNVEVGIAKDTTFEILSTAEVQNIIDRLPAPTVPTLLTATSGSA